MNNRFLRPDGKVISEHTDLYSPELSFVLAKRYDERTSRATMMKYETIQHLLRP